MDAIEVNRIEDSRRLPPSEDHVGMESTHQVEICRVCLLSSAVMHDLFYEDDALMLSEKAMSLTNVKIVPGDGLPSHICCDCGEKLELAYKFKLQVEQADNILREKIDSLNAKELFFSDVDVTLTQTNEVEEITQEGLLLKDHMELLNNHNINEDNVHNQEQQKQLKKVKNSEDEVQMEIQTVHGNHEIQQMPHEEHDQSFGTQELQDMMLNEISNQEVMQAELNENQQLTMHEHNYVAESQLCCMNNDNELSSQEEDTNIDKDLINEQFEVYEPTVESSTTESIRRSQRKINEHRNLVNQSCDEENYFENLNLSSRLKQSQLEKLEKNYFVCYLCDKQFLSKDILKEHMYSHEEVRKTLSIMSKSSEKLQQTPEKSQNTSESPISFKSPSSGKQPNTCPHCGKVYLYIIPYNKHIKQHEKEDNSSKEDPMPLEVSFQEDDDTLEFQEYDDNHELYSYSDNDEKKGEDSTYIKEELEKQILLNCNVCDEQFEEMDKLKDHRLQHAVDRVLIHQDIQNIKEFSPEPQIEKKIEEKESTESPVKEDIKELKCQHCTQTFSNKRSLARHVESHSNNKYVCKICHQSFLRKDLLNRHAEQHDVPLKSFKCTQCNKSFGNELTLRNHLIATNHKTIVHGQEYDPNKRIKRVAAKAAQKIIDQIKTDLSMDDFDDVEPESDKDQDFEDVKEEPNMTEDDEPMASKKQRNSKTLYCATCNQKSPSKQALTRHMEQHVKNEITVKQEKLKQTDESRECEENDDDEEDDDDFEGGLGWPMDSHECTTCKKRYSTKKSLLRHQLLHEEPNFECDICNVKFYRKDKLKAHYDKCSEKNPDQVRKCNICGDSFENNEILKEHRAKHVTEGILTEEDLLDIEPRPEDKNGEKAPRKRRTDIIGLECTECNKHYTSRKGLLRHIQVHEGKKYLCDICPKKFYRREHLKIHVAKHNMIKPYKCSRCPKRFIKEDQLTNHLNKHDRVPKKVKEADTSKRFLCEICSKSFTQSTTLIAHLRAHNGIKPYVCGVCTRPFTTNAYLKMHMRTHTQERPYICQYCSRAFARADTLANHLTSHTGEAKYHCKYCPKNFRRLKSLKEHVFIHTGQRPYACPTCDRRFNNNGSRYAHSKRCKQNLLQTRSSQMTDEGINIDQDMQEIHEIHEQEEQDQLQLQEEQEIENQLQSQRLHQATISQAQLIKPQNIKTITITRPDGAQQHVMAHQEILMPLILPLTVTLTDVGEEVILPEGTKIFTA